MKVSLLYAAGIVTLALSGCSKSTTDESKSPAPAAAPAAAAPPGEHTPDTPEVNSGDTSAANLESAKRIFAMRCQMCHGAAGRGDGPAAVSITPKPRDYSDATWQSSVSDADITKAILEGGGAIGKSQLMPANPDLKSQPEVVTGLVQLIRSFAK